jgi:hypothetical protein
MLPIITDKSSIERETRKKECSLKSIDPMSSVNYATRIPRLMILSMILIGFLVAVATLSLSAAPNPYVNVYVYAQSSSPILQPSLSQTPLAERNQQQATLMSPSSIVPPSPIYPQSVFPGTGSAQLLPYQTGLLGPTLPPPYSTYPPSVFPPTTSFATSTSIAPVTGPLSPWFPSVPAISCGGTFSMTVVGAMDTNGDDDDDNDDGNNNNNNRNNNDGDDNDNDDNNDRKLYAFQIQSDGGTALEPESIEGQVFRGENNIERNNGEDFDVKDVFNDCQVVTFSD